MTGLTCCPFLQPISTALSLSISTPTLQEDMSEQVQGPTQAPGPRGNLQETLQVLGSAALLGWGERRGVDKYVLTFVVQVFCFSQRDILQPSAET